MRISDKRVALSTWRAYLAEVPEEALRSAEELDPGRGDLYRALVENRAPVGADFWRALRPEVVAGLAADLHAEPAEVLLPAAWAVWLDSEDEAAYEQMRERARRIEPSGWGAEFGPLVASFFWHLLRPASATASLWSLAGPGGAARVGLLSVVPGSVRLSDGEHPLLWRDGVGVVAWVAGREVEAPAVMEGVIFDVVRAPIVLGRTTLSSSDSDLSTQQPEQVQLLRSLDLASTVRPIVGWRSISSAWTPAGFCWEGGREAALRYLLVKEMGGGSVPVTACFTNPSTSGSCCVQAPVCGVRSALAVEPTDPIVLAAEWILGVSSVGGVVDAAGRTWWTGSVRSSARTSPPGKVKFDVDAVVQLLLAAGCSWELDVLAGRAKTVQLV